MCMVFGTRCVAGDWRSVLCCGCDRACFLPPAAAGTDSQRSAAQLGQLAVIPATIPHQSHVTAWPGAASSSGGRKALPAHSSLTTGACTSLLNGSLLNPLEQYRHSTTEKVTNHFLPQPLKLQLLIHPAAAVSRRCPAKNLCWSTLTRELLALPVRPEPCWSWVLSTPLWCGRCWCPWQQGQTVNRWLQTLRAPTSTAANGPLCHTTSALTG